MYKYLNQKFWQLLKVSKNEIKSTQFNIISRNNHIFNIISSNNKRFEKFLQDLETELHNLRKIENPNQNELNRAKNLTDITVILEKKNKLIEDINLLSNSDWGQDKELALAASEETKVYNTLVENYHQEILEKSLCLFSPGLYSSVILEVKAGVGGQEAMLFAREIFEMYRNFLDYLDWKYDIIHEDCTDIKGLRHASIIIYESGAYNILEYEAGVHRVQRIPSTEKSGRIHTSTVTVAIIPRNEEKEFILNAKDLKIDTKRASGAGGQHVNTTDSAVRITHLPTNIVVECQTERSQIKNKEIAMKKLKLILLQLEITSQEEFVKAKRKSQIGTSNRNEKIRTYNYPQDRITDHRLKGYSIHHIENFLTGSMQLKNLINEIIRKKRLDLLMDKLNSFKNDK